MLDISSSGRIFYGAFEAGDHQTDAEQRPAQLMEEVDHRLNPHHLKQFHTHIAHSFKEIAQKSHDLAIEPVQQVIQDRGRYKFPNKYFESPQSGWDRRRGRSQP